MIDWSPILRHAGRAAFFFSGGKDSTAVLWLLKQAGMLDRVTVYHLNTGDLLPDMVAHVAALRRHCFNFVEVRTDPKAWAAQHGEPSDLVPYTAHSVGQQVGEGVKLSARYDCCYANLMAPIYERAVCDGNTLILRGTRRSDMTRLPAADGETHDGVEMFYPIQEWSDADVFAYLAREGVALPALYGHFRQAPECATCPAWWHEGRGPYLRTHHPAMYAEYYGRVSRVAEGINGPLRAYKAMVEDLAANELPLGNGLVVEAAPHGDVGLSAASGAEGGSFSDQFGLSVPVGEGALIHEPVSAGCHFDGACGSACGQCEGKQDGKMAHA